MAKFTKKDLVSMVQVLKDALRAWTVLITFLGEDVAGEKLKDTGLQELSNLLFQSEKAIRLFYIFAYSLSLNIFLK
jgi:hypothetical protein